MAGKRVLLIGCFSLVCFFNAVAQRTEGKVEVIQDSMIILLQQHRIAIENNPQTKVEHTKGVKGTVLGFRVQIYTGPNRNDAFDAQAKFKELYPPINTYISYTQPNYRVKIGDFRSRQEAESMMHELRKSFNSLFLFTEQVNIIY